MLLNQQKIIVISFTIFTLVVAFRDVIFRYLLTNNASLAIVCFWTGIFGLLFSFLSYNKKEGLQLNLPAMQFKRLVLNCFSSILLVYVFSQFAPSTIAIISKAGLPLAILIGALYGHIYTPTERKTSVFILLLIASFTCITYINGDAFTIGSFFLLILAIFLIVIEFMFLSASVKDENKFYLAATPCVSLILGGAVIAKIYGNSLFQLDVNLLLLCVIAGFMYYCAYYTSQVRYKFLPPGLAEYPSLLTYFVLLPIDILFFAKTFSFVVFISALSVLLFMTFLLQKRL